jgi:hypothetical protein
MRQAVPTTERHLWVLAPPGSGERWIAGSGFTAARAVRGFPVVYRGRSVPWGCFASAMAEFDCKAPGPVRDRIAKCQHEWVKTLERAARNAGAQGQLRAGSDPRRLALELEGALLTASWYFHRYADPGYLSRACRAYMPVAGEATPTGRRVLRPAPRPLRLARRGSGRRTGSSDDEAGHRLSAVDDGGRGLGP